MSNLLPKDHYFLTSSDDIHSIVQPLKDFFGLTSFVYQKNLLDGSEVRLSNQPAWVEFVFQHKLYQKSIFDRHIHQLKKNYYILSEVPQHQFIVNQAKQFNIHHTIAFIEPKSDGIEFYFLGTTKKNSAALLRVLNNLDLIEKFFDYFRITAAPLIKKSLEHRILIPDKIITTHPFSLEIVNRKEFLSIVANKKSNFTSRELECIQLLTSGYTMKMIAQKLNISYRTVETHFNHIKHKAHCHTKAELIQFFHSH